MKKITKILEWVSCFALGYIVNAAIKYNNPRLAAASIIVFIFILISNN